MKVLLMKDVPGFGRAGDIKTVSDGHARNFLIPKHLALPATTEMLARVQKEEAEHQQKIAREHEKFLALKAKLERKTFTIKAKATKNNLFAALHEKDIARAVSEATGVEISPELIHLEKPVKSLGSHDIEIRFAKTLTSRVKLDVQGL